MAFRTGQFDSIPLQEVVGGATHAHRYGERAKAMLATEIAVESGPAEATEREQRKYETLQQEARERIKGMQGSGEVGTEKERDWKEQCNLGGIETATLEPAVKRKSAHFHRAARSEEANKHDGRAPDIKDGTKNTSVMPNALRLPSRTKTGSAANGRSKIRNTRHSVAEPERLRRQLS